jgi:Fe(3+) dicitrate transport protein
LAGGIGASLTNGGATVHQGLELSARIDSGTIRRSRHNVYAGLAHTWLPIAEYRGVRFSSVPGFGSVSITGNRLPYAARLTDTVTVGYSNPAGMDVLAEAVYVGGQFADDLNTSAPTPDGQRGPIAAYVVWNATANYHVEAMRSTFFVSVKNLLDRTYVVDRARGILPGNPRLIHAGLKLTF